MKKIFSIIIFLFFIQHSNANDSTKTLSLKSFLQIVKQFHPVARQAALQVDKAAASLTIAKGSFDPLLSTGGNNKTFDGINYYQTNVIFNYNGIFQLKR